MHVKVLNYKSQDPNKVEEVRDEGLFSFKSREPEAPQSTELYTIAFKAESAIDKEIVLDRKIKNMKKKVDLGAGSEDSLVRLINRRQ